MSLSRTRRPRSAVRKLTIRDVALEARVGVGTVSRVLNESRHVSPETRRRVVEAIDRLRFRPDRMARGLVKGRTGTVGVLVPFFTKHYFLEILRGVEQESSRKDYSLIVYNVERVEQAVAHLEVLARHRRVDGLIVIALSGRLIGRAFAGAAPFPIVGVDTEIEGAMNIVPDHGQGMYLAVAHLASLGHRRIALIERPQDPVSGSVSPARESGYRRACKEAGLRHSPSLVTVAEYSREGGHEAARSLLAGRSPPTALACGSDLQAIGALEALAGLQRRVPADVAVTGYHDVELARYVGLTTVRIPAMEMGVAAAAMLIGALAGQPQEPLADFSPELVVRQTCGAKARHRTR